MSVSIANEPCDALTVAWARTSRVGVAGSGRLLEVGECPLHAGPQWQFLPQQQDFLPIAACPAKQPADKN